MITDTPGQPATPQGSLCGVWIDTQGRAHISEATATEGRHERVESFNLFAWLTEPAVNGDIHNARVEPLSGPGVFNRLAHADSLESYNRLVDAAKESGGVDALRPLESQYLLQRRGRLFQSLIFAQLRRCQLDIETACADGGFCDASRPDDRVLAIGLQLGQKHRLLVLEEMTDDAERHLLLQLNDVLKHEDPDVIEGHNIFKFDLDYLRQRARRLKVPCAWGRFGQNARFRNSRLKVAERWIDFPRCDLPGRAIVDTFLLVQLYDITAREMTSYGLKDAAVYFGITSEDAAEKGGRTYIAGGRIQEAFFAERSRFLAYLRDDLRETKGIADLLLPTYFEQTRSFPILLQDAALRGTTGKIDLLFLEEYYHARAACPVPPEVQPFEGGYTRSFQEGVYRHVLHFDVASLYPSLLLHIGRNPATDTLGVFIPLLRNLREYRLKYKQLARTAESEPLRAEYQARQANFKILINSFYGYLGFSGARFGDGQLAAEVTRRGRELLQQLIDEFIKHGCVILEADTDGIYLSSAEWFDKPEELLAAVEQVLPEGIELEHDGSYDAMFCYKAKNYALREGDHITIRGSALRSRGIEPYLKKLSDLMIAFLLGAERVSPAEQIDVYRRSIAGHSLPVAELAKTEALGQNAEAYEKFVAAGGKPRRAAAEAALLIQPRPRMGDRVMYYVTAKTKGRTNDWQRARPVSLYDAINAPYDAEYYLKKLDDWVDRYAGALGIEKTKTPPVGGVQGELF